MFSPFHPSQLSHSLPTGEIIVKYLGNRYLMMNDESSGMNCGLRSFLFIEFRVIPGIFLVLPDEFYYSFGNMRN